MSKSYPTQFARSQNRPHTLDEQEWLGVPWLSHKRRSREHESQENCFHLVTTTTNDGKDDDDAGSGGGGDEEDEAGGHHDEVMRVGCWNEPTFQ